ncbi:MAG: GNAT family N-acetyltransferase [Thermomicrobiales bacterium]
MSAPADAEQAELVIADLQPRDTDAIDQAAALLMAAFPDWTPTMKAARDEIVEALAPNRICLAARSGAAVLGWVGGLPEYSHAWELHPLVVREDARGRGIGRALVAALEERVRARGALTLYLGTDDDGPLPGTSAGGVDLFPNVLSHAVNLRSLDHAAGFYRRLGFEVVGLIPDANGHGKPDVLMAKRIALDAS